MLQSTSPVHSVKPSWKNSFIWMLEKKKKIHESFRVFRTRFTEKEKSLDSFRVHRNAWSVSQVLVAALSYSSSSLSLKLGRPCLVLFGQGHSEKSTFCWWWQTFVQEFWKLSDLLRSGGRYAAFSLGCLLHTQTSAICWTEINISQKTNTNYWFGRNAILSLSSCIVRCWKNIRKILV